MRAVDVVVVGGGVAGLSAAWALSPGRRVVLCEADARLCAHASGRNAAIHRPLEHDATSAALSAVTLARLAELSGEPPLRRVGVLLVAARPEPISALEAHARAQQVPVQRLDRGATWARWPLLRGGDIEHALLVTEGGVLDIAAMNATLAEAAVAQGADVRRGTPVERIVVERGRVASVQLRDGGLLPCGQVVLAAGAWGSALGAAAGAALPLQAHQRHLAELELGTGAELSPAAPVIWRVDDDELYFRPAGSALLASPCDADPRESAAAHADPRALEALAQKLARTAPALRTSRVLDAWACLRTFAPDHELVVGEDPRVSGLCWLAGLGGRGMAVAVGAAELLRDVLAGRDDALARAVDPARLCGASAA